MNPVVFWLWMLTAAMLVVAVIQQAWYAWENFKARSRLREYQRTGTWTERWWR